MIKMPISSASYNFYSSMSPGELTCNLKYCLQQFQMSDFWTLMTIGSTNPIIAKTITSISELAFKDFLKLDNTNNVEDFLNGFCYFLIKQRVMTNKQITGSMNNKSNLLFEKAFQLEKWDYLPLLAELITNKDLSNFNDLHLYLIKQSGTESLKKLYSFCQNISPEILQIYGKNDFYNYLFTKEIIDQYHLDINTLENISPSQLAYTHFLFTTTNHKNDFFHNFIVDFGNKINFDINSSSGLLLDILPKSQKSPIDFMNVYSDILTYCQLTEKHISKIANSLLNSILPIQFYDHITYDKLFNHQIFNSKYFDKTAILKNILLLDNNVNMKKLRNKNQLTVNPIVILLDKFYKTNKIYQLTDNKEHPFVYWANLQKSDYCLDTCKYLVEKYRNEFIKLNPNTFKNLNFDLKKELKTMGIKNINTQGFFDKIFGKKVNSVEPVMEEIEPEKLTPITTNLFNTSLINQVKDSEINLYIESIQLNSEQYCITAQEFSNDNGHYIITLLPKFLNKAVSNYLSFAAIDPVQAKENTLVQLKLLNKKTFEILNECLEEQKQIFMTADNIQKRIIKNY